MGLNLAELFVLAACGKLGLQHAPDDPSGMDAGGGADYGRKTAGGSIQNAASLIKGKDPLVEESLNQRGGDGASGESVSGSHFVDGG